MQVGDSQGTVRDEPDPRAGDGHRPKTHEVTEQTAWDASASVLGPQQPPAWLSGLQALKYPWLQTRPATISPFFGSQEGGEASWGMLGSEQHHLHTNLSDTTLPRRRPRLRLSTRDQMWERSLQTTGAGCTEHPGPVGFSLEDEQSSAPPCDDLRAL